LNSSPVATNLVEVICTCPTDQYGALAYSKREAE
jgi:hypothetical protein